MATRKPAVGRRATAPKTAARERASAKARPSTKEHPAPRQRRQPARALSRRRGEEQLLSSLAAGLPIEQAAKTAGISERTAYRRLQEPRFQQQLAAVRDELISVALGELAGCASHAVATLNALLDAGEERIRLQAARTLLEQLLRLREAITLEQRVATLERHFSR
jgi:hypothetical protein